MSWQDFGRGLLLILRALGDECPTCQGTGAVELDYSYQVECPECAEVQP